MRHLRARMYARVGAPGGNNLVLAWLQLGQRRLDRALHRDQPNLTLPPDKGRAIVFNFESVSGHGQGDSAGRAGEQSPKPPLWQLGLGMSIYPLTQSKGAGIGYIDNRRRDHARG